MIFNKSSSILKVLAFVFPSHFSEEQTLSILIDMIGLITEDLQPLVLTSLTYVGKMRPIGKPYNNWRS